MRYVLLFIILFTIGVTLLPSAQADNLDNISGYWTTDRWGDHMLCIYEKPAKEGARAKCFKVPERVYRQVAA